MTCKYCGRHTELHQLFCSEQCSIAYDGPLSEVPIITEGLGENIALAKIGEERLKTFKRSESLSTEELLEWNKTRKVGE